MIMNDMEEKNKVCNNCWWKQLRHVHSLSCSLTQQIKNHLIHVKTLTIPLQPTTHNNSSLNTIYLTY